MGKTHISWATDTWNPISGCTRVSSGCDHCYIERTPPFRMAGRKFDGTETGSTTGVTLHPERLDQPLHWRKPRLVFVNSLSDVFHEAVPDEYIARIFAIMALAPHHTFQVLTKRHARMRSLLSSTAFRDLLETEWCNVQDWSTARLPDPEFGAVDTWPGSSRHAGRWPLPNAWLGVSVEDQKWADIRIPALLDTPAAVRFLSCEPLLGPVTLEMVTVDPSRAWNVLDDAAPFHPAIDWVICGGESGPGARPMHPRWARSLRDQCVAAGVPFHFKQWGEYMPIMTAATTLISRPAVALDETWSAFRVGKKAAGRSIDGRTWDEYPRTAEAVSA